MKRLNPKTNKPYKRGDRRDKDDKVFMGYYGNRLGVDGYFIEQWSSPNSYIINVVYNNAKSRARRSGLPFNLDKDYLVDIMEYECPIFGIPLSWGIVGEGNKKTNNSPSLDRIVPEYGYIKGNVVFISNLANTIKQNVTEKELYAVADWLHDERKRVLKDVEPIAATPIPKRAHRKSKDNSQSGSILATWLREDCYNVNNHSGAIHRIDIDHRAQEGSGDGVGSGGKEVEPSITLTRIENHGDAEPEIIRLDFGRGYLPD